MSNRSKRKVRHHTTALTFKQSVRMGQLKVQVKRGEIPSKEVLTQRMLELGLPLPEENHVHTEECNHTETL